MEQNVVLEMRDISKNFTGVRALSHVDFTLRKGEIHALMGENGAGKSRHYQSFSAGGTGKWNQHGISGSKPLSEPDCCGKPVYWP